MKKNTRYERQKDHWEFAGKVGYGKAQFLSGAVEQHIMGKQWAAALAIAQRVGLGSHSRIIELGCGDGCFAAQVLAPNFQSVDAYDNSGAAIESARTHAQFKNLNYMAKDIINLTYAEGNAWDGAFLMCFLHHAKPFAASIIERLAKVCDKAVVLEPNGDNCVRKGLELLPSYKKAGENSFRLKELRDLFSRFGFQQKILMRINLAPSFLPKSLLPLFQKAEAYV